MAGERTGRIRPRPGGFVARAVAVLVGTVAVVALVGASVTGPWWYTWRAWGLAALGALAGATVVWALAVPAPQPIVAGDGPSERPGPGARHADRHELAVALVDLLDVVPTESLRYRVSRALSDAGVTEFCADGEVFDPERHHVVEVEWTDDPQRESRVARTVRPGFADGASVVRAAEVLVYRSSRALPAGSPGRRAR